MADPYTTFFWQPKVDPTKARQFAPNTDVLEQQVRAESQRYIADTRLLQESQKELGKTDERLLKARLAEKKQRYAALTAANSQLQKHMASLAKATTETFAAEARAAATAYAATIRAQVELVKGQYSFEPGDYVGFISAMKVSPREAIAALTGSMNKLSQTGSKYMQPALINKILEKIFFEDPREFDVTSDRDELAAALSAKGVDPTVIDSFLESKDLALEAWNAVDAAEDAANRSLSDVEGVIARGVKSEAALKAESAAMLERFTVGLDGITAVTDAKPDTLLASIDDDNRALEARDILQKRVDELWKRREAYTAEASKEGDIDGRILADDNFRLWAADNGYEEIGVPHYDDEGRIIGASKGRQYNNALYEFNWQMNHSGKWNDVFKPGKGSATNQVVEVSYVPAEAPKAAVVGANVYVKIGDQVWVDGPDGTFVQADEPEGAEWALAARRNGEGFAALDSLDGVTIGDVMIPEGTEEKAAVGDIYAKKIVGAREKQQAAFMLRHGEDGYVAVIDPETGERIEVSGTLKPTVKVLSGGYSDPGVDSARRKGLRAARRGILPGAPAQRPADGKPTYQFGGVTILDGDESNDPAVARIRAKIAEQDVEEDPTQTIGGGYFSDDARAKRRAAMLDKRRPNRPEPPAWGEDVPEDAPVQSSVDRSTPTRIEGLSYEGMAEDYKRRNLGPSSPDTTVGTRTPVSPSETTEAPTAEDIGLISPSQADRNSDAYWKAEARKRALAARRAAAQQ